jgi:(R)-2-hydroxyacyl-CoA dehydratese activating ATPase
MPVMGIDIGSAFVKCVVMAEDKVLSCGLQPSGGNYKNTAAAVVAETLRKAGLRPADIACTIATGYGSANTVADEVATDISCDGRGVHRLFPAARTVIDIGGQFSRVFRVDEHGQPTAFLLSEKCATGSGRFLQIIARVLQVELSDIGEMSLRSQKEIEFNTGCAVFAESEAISRIAEGASREDILAGVHRALASKIRTMVERVRPQPEYAVVGGGGRDIGLVRAIEAGLECRLLVPEEPQTVAALGAAIIAGEKLARTAINQ